MQAIWYAVEYKPKGFKSYILSSTLSSAKLLEQEQKRRISYMDEVNRQALLNAEIMGDSENEAYLRALAKFMGVYCAGQVTDESPEFLRRPKQSGIESYVVGYGKNEFSPTGTLAGYKFTERLHEITEACLITSGAIDVLAPAHS